MNKLLETAVERVATLDEADQELAAELLEQLVASRGAPYRLNANEQGRVAEALDRARAGDFASDETVADVLSKPWR